MADLKIEQVESFFTNLGLAKSDFDTISTTEVTDYEPYITKIKGNIAESLRADTSFIDEITKPFKDLPIGKENQLKKALRKGFGLNYSEDELKKMPFDDLVIKAKEAIAGGSATQTNELQQQLTEYMEKHEALQNDIPNQIEANDKKWQAKFDALTIRDEVSQLVAVESQVKKENIPNFTTIFLGFVAQSGFKIQIDAKKVLRLTDSDGNPAKTTDGAGILKVKDLLKTFGETLNANIQPRGTTTTTTLNGASKDLAALELMGRGFKN